MKILFALDTYRTNNNGTSISAQRFAEVLRKHGHEVRILATDERYGKQTGLHEDTYVLREEKIPIFNELIHKHGFRFAKCDKKIICQAVEWADVVHCLMPFVLTRVVKRETDRQGKPCTAAFHIQPENITSSINMGKIKPVTSFVYQLWWQMIYRNFSHIHCPSKFQTIGHSKRFRLCANWLLNIF